jgi:chromosome segregation ATPase
VGRESMQGTVKMQTISRVSLNISQIDDNDEAEDQSESELRSQILALKAHNIELVNKIEIMSTTQSKQKADISHLQDSLKTAENRIRKLDEKLSFSKIAIDKMKVKHEQKCNEHHKLLNEFEELQVNSHPSNSLF